MATKLRIEYLESGMAPRGRLTILVSMRTCPYCTNSISDYVIKCVHCGTWLVENPPVVWSSEERVAPPPVDPIPQFVPEDPATIPGGGDTLPPVMIIPEEEPAEQTA